MTMFVAKGLSVLIGLAGGIAVGSGVVALITVLNILPRFVQIAKNRTVMHAFELALVFGTLLFTIAHFFKWKLQVSTIGVAVIGGFQGAFMGTLAASLIEVLNVVPIMTKRARMQNQLGFLLTAVVLGKTVGSLFDWIVFQKLH